MQNFLFYATFFGLLYLCIVGIMDKVSAMSDLLDDGKFQYSKNEVWHRSKMARLLKRGIYWRMFILLIVAAVITHGRTLQAYC